MTHYEKPPAPLDRFLRLFGDVRGGEGLTALLLSLNVFLIFAAYYMIKPLRDGLIISEYSAEVKSYMAPVQILVLTLIVPLYGVLADRLPRRRLINIVTWGFTAFFVAFFFAGQAGLHIGAVFFVFASIFNVMVVAQFWSFANDVYTRKEGERLFPIVQFGASFGAVIGAGVIAIWVRDTGVYVPLLLTAGVLLAQVQITNFIDTRERERREAGKPKAETTLLLTATGMMPAPKTIEELEEAAEEERRQQEAAKRGETVEAYEAPPSGLNAFQLVWRTPYLLLICSLVLLLNWVNTNGEYILGHAIEEIAANQLASGAIDAAGESAMVSGFFAGFQMAVNIAGLFLQMFLVSRIVKWIGAGWAVRVLPLISLGAYSLIAFVPVLAVIRSVKIAENATDYSLNNTIRAMLFLPTTREQKYKAKQVSDSFSQRVGDLLSTATVFVCAGLLSLSATAFAMINIALVLVWLVVATAIGRQYAALVASGQPPVVRGTAPAGRFEAGMRI